MIYLLWALICWVFVLTMANTAQWNEIHNIKQKLKVLNLRVEQLTKGQLKRGRK